MKKFYLGGDVSKGYCDFVLLDAAKQPMMDHFQLDDTLEGHRRLYTILDQFVKTHPGAALYAGLESTGGYENNWYASLLRFHSTLPLQAARLNPAGVYHNSKADLKRNTTDKLSARHVAEYLLTHPEKVVYQYQDPLAGPKKHYRLMKLLTKQRTQLFNHFEALLYGSHPALLAYCQDGVPTWVLKLVDKYPTAPQLARAKVASVARIPYVTRARAMELIRLAKKTIASDPDPISGRVLQATVKQILHLQHSLAGLTEQLKNECACPEVDLLKTFIGIADHSAIGLFLEIQSVERFATVKKLAAFFGVHPVYKQSGDGKGRFKMSKAGRTEPRRLLFLVAKIAIQRNPLIQEVYLRHQKNGKCKMAALGVCMHKILRILYGMLKQNKPFDPEIDRQNQKKQRRGPRPAPENKARRFQDYDETAPISKRQARKRVAREGSQSGNTTVCGISPPNQEKILTQPLNKG